jgi:hypothetical protein
VSSRITLAIAANFLAIALWAATSAGSATSDETIWGSPKPGWDYYESFDYGAWALLSPPAQNADEVRPAYWADAGSDHTTFSQDNREVRLISFDSAASNLVPGDTNGQRDVFVIGRAVGGANLAGKLDLASKGRGSTLSNGPSYEPSLDGQTRVVPHCLSFTSQATNLDRGDRSPDPDIYLRDLRTRTTRLVSRGFAGATHSVVDGRCTIVSFAARGSVWLASLRSHRTFFVARGREQDLQTNGRGVAYVDRGQVWYRALALAANGRHLERGRARLVSSTAAGNRGNGSSSHPALDDRGNYVAFQSTATDLCNRRRCIRFRGDANGANPDIFRRTMSKRAPTHDSMEMVSSGGGVAPAISAAGENIVFAAPAGDAIWYMNPGYKPVRSPAVELASWSFPRHRGYGDVKTVRRTGCYPNACLNKVSNVSMSARGNYVAFTAPMPEFCAPRRPRGFAGDRECHDFTDVFIRFMGWSHEGYPLG